MPRIALVHGFLGSPADWADLLAHLAPGIEADCVPLAELGCASVDDAAAALADRLEARPVDLLAGYSLGGRIALELAASRPALAPRLVLLAAGLGIEDDAERAARAASDDALAARLATDGLARFIDAWYELPLFADFRRHPSFEATRARRLAGDGAFWTRCLSGCSAGRTRPRWTSLPELAPRTTLAVGALDERYAAAAARAVCIAPALRVETVPAAGHALPLEAPERCARLVEEALARPAA
jgi:2-succinyl-6-hydroxy-2,4-cyclohexadiene-1-carboxylate synthase